MKRIIITNPAGQQTVITEEKKGCLWWFGTAALILFFIGLLAVYPLLLIPTGLVGIGYGIYLIRRSRA